MCRVSPLNNMKSFLVIILINLVQLIVFCNADKHSYGDAEDINDSYRYKMSEKVLIDDVNITPKNYVLMFKYFASFYNPVTYIEIDVNSPSTGSIQRFRGSVYNSYLDIDVGTSNFKATIYINNTLNVRAVLSLYSFGTKPLKSLLDNLDITKSFTVIYTKNANSTSKPSAHNSIGKRQKGDQLIHFKSCNVTNLSRFPSRAFEYSGGEFITYVGFSFNSPTAIAMVNTSFIGEREFNAIVYDMNTPHFVANMSVYGITGAHRGHKFIPII